MADRKQFFGSVEFDPELQKILEESRRTPVTEQELREQRISFAFGNAPVSATTRGPDRFSHRPPKKAATPSTKMLIVNVSVTWGMVQ